MPLQTLASSVMVVDYILRYTFQSVQLTLVLNPEQAFLTSLTQNVIPVVSQSAAVLTMIKGVEPPFQLQG